MVRVPASLALIGIMALALAACGSPETTPAADSTTAAAPANEQTPVMPDDAPPQEEAMADTAPAATSDCLAELGAAASARLVERCIAVSPATHPPCNAANPCALIQSEIDRACGQYGPGETKPAECAA